jgi:hypothetical protein
MPESEKVTELYLANEMLKIGGISFKWTSPGRRGVPDRICIFPCGLIVFAEIKSEGIKPKAHQIRFAELMDSFKVESVFLDTKAQVDVFIHSHLNQGEK